MGTAGLVCCVILTVISVLALVLTTVFLALENYYLQEKNSDQRLEIYKLRRAKGSR